MMKKLRWMMGLCTVASLALVTLIGGTQKGSETGQKQIAIKKEQAIEIALREVPIPPNYRLSACRLDLAYIGDEIVWVVGYTPIDKRRSLEIFGAVEGVRIDIDPQTGEVICFTRFGLTSVNTPLRLTPKEAIEKAKSFLTPWIQRYTTWENLQLREKPYLRIQEWEVKGKKIRANRYEIDFRRIVDGWLWGGNGWTVSVDASSGEILFYYRRWTKERVWVDDRNLMPKEKAIELVVEEIKRRGLKVHLTGEVSVQTYGFGEKQPDGSLRIPLIYIVHYDKEVPKHLEEEFRKIYGRPFWPGGCKIDPYTGKFISPPRDFRER